MTRAELIEHLNDLANHMRLVAAELNINSGLGDCARHGQELEEMTRHGVELCNCAEVVRTWADGLEQEPAT